MGRPLAPTSQLVGHAGSLRFDPGGEHRGGGAPTNGSREVKSRYWRHFLLFKRLTSCLRVSSPVHIRCFLIAHREAPVALGQSIPELLVPYTLGCARYAPCDPCPKPEHRHIPGGCTEDAGQSIPAQLNSCLKRRECTPVRCSEKFSVICMKQVASDFSHLYILLNALKLRISTLQRSRK